MLRELPLQAAVTSYRATSIAGLVFRLQGYVYTAANPAVDYYIQLFDSLETAGGAAGLVPLKSWEGQANFQFIFHESEGIPITNGALFVLSTTDAIYTPVVGGGNVMDIQVEIEEYSSLAQEFTPNAILNIDLGTGGFTTITADNGGTTYPLLTRVDFRAQNGPDCWLMVFAKSPIAGDKSITQRKMFLSTLGLDSSNKIIPAVFGDQNGFRSYSQSVGGVNHNGLYIALSSTGDVYTAFAAAAITGNMDVYWFDNTAVAP